MSGSIPVTRNFALVLVLLLVPIIASAQNDPDDIYWDKRFPAIGMNGPVFAIASYGDVVFLGGRFTEAGGIATHNIIAWNRTTYLWSNLGDGVRGDINTMAVVGDDLFVGGSFTDIEGVPASNLARWNITQGKWFPVGSGPNVGTDDVVRVFTVHDGGLYVGGDFKRAGTLATTCIARLDPTTGAWTKVVNSLRVFNIPDPSVSAIAFKGNELFLGGLFGEVDGAKVSNVAHRTAAGVWKGMVAGPNPGVSGRVTTFAVTDTVVYMAGEFGAAGPNIGVGGSIFNTEWFARWNSGNETFASIIPSGTNSNYSPRGPIRQLLIHGGYMYAVGLFDEFAISGTGGPVSVPAPGIGRWDFRAVAGSWHIVNGGLDGYAYSMGLIQGDLVVGGDFNRAGEITASRAAIFNGIVWSPLTNIPDNGVNGPIYAQARIGKDLYVGGDFTVAGGRPARSIARWDGHIWYAVGTGVDSVVRSITVIGTDIYVGGSFTKAGGTPAVNVARWNGTAWSAVGAGLPGQVHALTTDGTTLYAGGLFTAKGNVSKWNGSAWSVLGTGTDSTVRTLSAGGGWLYVGGDFKNAGGTAAARVARWNIGGSAWSAMGTGLGGGISGFESAYTMLVDGNRVLVGGEFTTAGTVTSNYFAIWQNDLQAWTNLGEAAGKGPCNAVHAIAVKGSDIYLGGEFLLAGDVPVNKVVRWNGTNWIPLGGAAENGVNNLVTTLLLIGDTLYTGGSFVATADGFANRVSAYTGTVWLPLGGSITSGLNGWVHAVVFDGTDVYLGGRFNATGTSTVNHIVKWNNTLGQWSSLGPGTDGTVYALSIVNGLLYVGGEFTQAGDVVARGIAIWNIATRRWSSFGNVRNNGVDGTVMAIASKGDRVYLGGSFLHAGDTTTCNRVVAWNTTALGWETLGTGADSTVFALGVSGNYLYVGGEFRHVGAEAANYIGRWNIKTGGWQRLGGGTNAPVRAITVDGSNVYMGGDFVVAGTVSATHVTRWDNNVEYFARLGEGIEGSVDAKVNALAFNKGTLYVGGEFPVAGTDSVKNIARYDVATGAWNKLGSGIDGVGVSPTVFALAASGDHLFAGGAFNRAGGAPSYYVSHWERSISVSVPFTNRSTPTSLLRAQPYPNPASLRTTFPFHLESSGRVELLLTDASGRDSRIIFADYLAAGDHDVSINTEDLPAGAWIVRLRSNGHVESHVVVVEH